jgi:hypothetical protein
MAPTIGEETRRNIYTELVSDIQYTIKQLDYLTADATVTQLEKVITQLGLDITAALYNADQWKGK